MCIIYTDIHRVAAEVVPLVYGKLTKLICVQMLREHLEAFARREIIHNGHGVIEVTRNVAPVAELLVPFVEWVIAANPKQVRMIAHAKIKTDAIDAAVMAKPHATGFMPEVWVPDARTHALRRQVVRRTQLVRQCVCLKNVIQSILPSHLVPPGPHSDLVGIRGRKWLAKQIVPQDESAAIDQQFGQIDVIEAALKVVKADIADEALVEPVICQIMTLPSLDMKVAIGVSAAIGDLLQLPDPQTLVGYLSLSPSVRHCGERPAYYGRITSKVEVRHGAFSSKRHEPQRDL